MGRITSAGGGGGVGGNLTIVADIAALDAVLLLCL